MTRARVIAIALLLAGAVGSACASSGSKDPFVGAKSLDATVVERQYDPPGSAGASYAGTGNYYLVFEATEGGADLALPLPGDAAAVHPLPGRQPRAPRHRGQQPAPDPIRRVTSRPACPAI